MRKPLAVSLWGIFIGILTCTLLFQFPWSHTYKREVAPYRRIRGKSVLVIEETDYTRSPCWRYPGHWATTETSWVPTTPGYGQMSVDIVLVPARRAWRRFSGELTIGLLCGVFLHVVLFALSRPSLRVCRFAVLSLIVPGLGSLCTLGLRQGWKRFLALLLPIPIAWVVIFLWHDVFLENAYRGVREAKLYPCLLTSLAAAVIASVVCAIKDARSTTNKTELSAVEQSHGEATSDFAPSTDSEASHA